MRFSSGNADNKSTCEPEPTCQIQKLINSIDQIKWSPQRCSLQERKFVLGNAVNHGPPCTWCEQLQSGTNSAKHNQSLDQEPELLNCNDLKDQWTPQHLLLQISHILRTRLSIQPLEYELGAFNKALHYDYSSLRSTHSYSDIAVEFCREMEESTIFEYFVQPTTVKKKTPEKQTSIDSDRNSHLEPSRILKTHSEESTAQTLLIIQAIRHSTTHFLSLTLTPYWTFICLNQKRSMYQRAYDGSLTRYSSHVVVENKERFRQSWRLDPKYKEDIDIGTPCPLKIYNIGAFAVIQFIEK